MVVSAKAGHDAGPCSPLYPLRVGTPWERLPHYIRRSHAGRDAVHLSGRFRIEHGGPVARVVARLLRLPSPAESVIMHVEIAPGASGATWTRSIRERSFATIQSALPDGRLCERIGGLEFCFRLNASDDSLVYVPEGVRVRFGSRAVRAP